MLNVEGVTIVSDNDREMLTRPFELVEVKMVVFDLKQYNAPGLDGMPGEFYMKFWDLIKQDLLDIINDFHKGLLNNDRLNYGIITLIPKTKDASQIKKFRKIFLLNVSFKILRKVLMNRINDIIAYIVSKNQTKDIYIVEGVVVLDEILNTFH